MKSRPDKPSEFKFHWRSSVFPWQRKKYPITTKTMTAMAKPTNVAGIQTVTTKMAAAPISASKKNALIAALLTDTLAPITTPVHPKTSVNKESARGHPRTVVILKRFVMAVSATPKPVNASPCH